MMKMRLKQVFEYFCSQKDFSMPTFLTMFVKDIRNIIVTLAKYFKICLDSIHEKGVYNKKFSQCCSNLKDSINLAVDSHTVPHIIKSALQLPQVKFLAYSLHCLICMCEQYDTHTGNRHMSCIELNYERSAAAGRVAVCTALRILPVLCKHNRIAPFRIVHHSGKNKTCTDLPNITLKTVGDSIVTVGCQPVSYKAKEGNSKYFNSHAMCGETSGNTDILKNKLFNTTSSLMLKRPLTPCASRSNYIRLMSDGKWSFDNMPNILESITIEEFLEELCRGNITMDKIFDNFAKTTQLKFIPENYNYVKESLINSYNNMHEGEEYRISVFKETFINPLFKDMCSRQGYSENEIKEAINQDNLRNGVENIYNDVHDDSLDKEYTDDFQYFLV